MRLTFRVAKLVVEPAGAAALAALMHPLRQRFGALFRCETHGAPRFQVDESRRHLTPVTELECALAQPASGDDADGVGHATVDLHIRHQPFAVFAVRVVEPKQLESEHRHPHAQHLPGTEMSVGKFGVAQ